MGNGTLVAQVDPAYLWGALDQGALVPSMQFHVANAASRVISERSGTQSIPVQHHRRPAVSTGTSAASRIFAAFAPFMDGDRVATPPWTLVVSEARSAVVAPMDDFRRSFPLAVALALGAAVFLSLSQLRRNLAPLDALYSGTRRLAEGQFDQPVVVTSRDEFAEVAASFNAMSDRDPAPVRGARHGRRDRPHGAVVGGHAVDRAHRARAHGRHLSL